MRCKWGKFFNRKLKIDTLKENNDFDITTKTLCYSHCLQIIILLYTFYTHALILWFQKCLAFFFDVSRLLSLHKKRWAAKSVNTFSYIQCIDTELHQQSAIQFPVDFDSVMFVPVSFQCAHIQSSSESIRVACMVRRIFYCSCYKKQHHPFVITWRFWLLITNTHWNSVCSSQHWKNCARVQQWIGYTHTRTQNGVASSELGSLNTKNSKPSETKWRYTHCTEGEFMCRIVRAYTYGTRENELPRGKVWCCCCFNNIQFECRNASVVCMKSSVEPG